MERVLASSRVEGVPAPPESSYLGELARRFQRGLIDAVAAGARWLHVPPRVLWWIVAAGAVLVVALFLWLLASWLRRRPRGVEPGSVTTAAAGTPVALLDAAGWRAELERRLAEGRIPEALEALWWWLARSLTGAKAEPDWTSRDLVARSRRDSRHDSSQEDLRDLVRRLDAYTYGPRSPAPEDLRALVGRLEETLA
jgi:hypothetical protein